MEEKHPLVNSVFHMCLDVIVRMVSNIGILTAYAVIYFKLDSCYFKRSKSQIDIQPEKLAILKES